MDNPILELARGAIENLGRDVQEFTENMNMKVLEIHQRAQDALIELENIARDREQELEEESLLNEVEVEDAQGSYEGLSDAANNALFQLGGPIDPNSFKSFLMLEAKGKPRPPLLPIVRHFTDDINGLIIQLTNLKATLNDNHLKYMDQRRLDRNLNSRIDRLLINMKKELAEERRQGLQQRSMSDYLIPPNNQI